MKVIARDIWLCDDCTMVAVNGDYSGLDYHLTERQAARRAAEIDAGLDRLPGLVPDNTPDEPQHRCEACGWHGPSSEVVDVYNDPEYPDWCEDGCPNCKSTEDLVYDGTGFDEFSTEECDCCGTSLGGSRHRFAQLGPDDGPQLELFAQEATQC